MAVCMKLSVEYVDIDSIKPSERNAKLHPEQQIEQIKKSITDYGMRDPIGVWHGEIVEGHGRLMACKELGYKEIPIIRLDDLTDEQRREYMLVHNKTTMNSDFDFDILNAELEDLPDFDAEFYEFELEIDDEEPQQIVEDEVPEEVETRCKVGDIWQMGRHRLICGDSTDSAVIDRLMDGVKADMLFTSPPYSDMREYNGGKDLSVSNISKFIWAYKPYTDYQCVNLGIQRKNHEIVQYWDEYIAKARECGYKLLAWNVWDKTKCGSIGNQSAFFPIRHEWIFVFGTEFFEINNTWKKAEDSIKSGEKARRVRQSDGSMKVSSTGDLSNPYKQMESVIQILPEQGEIIKKHPATFPVQLPAEYIKAMTDEGGSVIEPFGGSGSTLIACEQLNRKCYMAELDPKYCDVIIQRWENFTGKKAMKMKGDKEK